MLTAAPAADLLTIESQTASEADTLTDTDTRPPAADLLTVATADSQADTPADLLTGRRPINARI